MKIEESEYAAFGELMYLNYVQGLAHALDKALVTARGIDVKEMSETALGLRMAIADRIFKMETKLGIPQ